MPLVKQGRVLDMTIALTGGIAAGKSTVRQLLTTHLNMRVFDADACVRLLLETNLRVIEEVGRRFGAGFIRSDGTADRGALRELVFHNTEARRELETLLHPLVRAEWQAASERAEADRCNFLADIPLLYETGAELFFDAVIVVACSRATQFRRLQDRTISAETANAMLASQLPVVQKIATSDFVIWNEGSFATLSRQTELVIEQLLPS
jgi:dephospho-CoA kinase